METGVIVQGDTAAQVRPQETQEIACRIKWFGIGSDLTILVGVTQGTGKNEG
jgi:hypothetical protein